MGIDDTFRKPQDIHFIKSLGVKPNKKRFLSVCSLIYEQSRLDTFIGWPGLHVSPRDLAANGFYYLRRDELCACVFCCVVIGDWKDGDGPQV